LKTSDRRKIKAIDNPHLRAQPINRRSNGWGTAPDPADQKCLICGV
jgi:hypothetical protein